MNVKKVKLADVQDGTVSYADFRKEMLGAVAELEAKHTSFETAVPFYACIDQKFDGGKSQDLLFVIGDLKAEWKPYLNSQLKDGAQKKKILWGTCYFENVNGENTIQICPTKGSAKLVKISKAGKALFKKADVCLAIPKGLARPEDLENEGAEEENEENSENPNSTTKENEPTQNSGDKELKNLQSTWAEIASTHGTLKDIKDPKILAQAIYKLHDLSAAFNLAKTQYNDLLKDADATEKAMPGITQKIAEMKAKLDENPKYQAIFKIGDSFKKRVQRLNQVLTAIGQETITI